MGAADNEMPSAKVNDLGGHLASPFDDEADESSRERFQRPEEPPLSICGRDFRRSKFIDWLLGGGFHIEVKQDGGG